MAPGAGGTVKRDAFLARIRQALHRQEGDPVEAPPAVLEPPGKWDLEALVSAFRRECEAVGAVVHEVAEVAEAGALLGSLLSDLNARTFLASEEDIVAEVMTGLPLVPAEVPAEAEVGITGVLCALADTGTLVLSSEVGRQASLLPPAHVALVRREQLLPGMAEALARFAPSLPSAWVQVTGPSRTADIELTLTMGVHGPGVLQVLLISA